VLSVIVVIRMIYRKFTYRFLTAVRITRSIWYVVESRYEPFYTDDSEAIDPSENVANSAALTSATAFILGFNWHCTCIAPTMSYGTIFQQNRAMRGLVIADLKFLLPVFGAPSSGWISELRELNCTIFVEDIGQ